MSINVMASCRTHGPGVEIFRIGKRKFCAKCVSSFLAKQGHEIEMVTIENEPAVVQTEQTSLNRHNCPECSMTWSVTYGRACPKCGTVAE